MDMIKRFVRYYKPHKRLFMLDTACSLMVAVCDLFYPMIAKNITNVYVPNKELRLLLVWAGVLLGIYLIKAALNYIIQYWGHIVGVRIQGDMRRDMFMHLQKLSFTYYDSAKVGQIMSRITTDLFDITEFAHHCPEEFFIAAIKITVSFVILLNVNVWLTLIMFAVIPMMLFVTATVRKKMRAAFKEQRQRCGELNASVEDSLLGIRVVKSFANEDIENQKFEQGNTDFFRVKAKAYKYMAAFQTSTRVFDGVMYIVVVVIGAIFMISETIRPGDYVAYLLYVSTLLASVRRMLYRNHGRRAGYPRRTRRSRTERCQRRH